MAMRNFKEQIKDPRWQRRRLEIMQRDDFKCQICGGGDKTLNVHHLYYDKNKDYWDYTDEGLITLCEDCHEKEHGEYKDGLNDVIEEMREFGITNYELLWFLKVVSVMPSNFFNKIIDDKNPTQLDKNLIRLRERNENAYIRKYKL